jgi:hypothetical protein
MLKAEHERLTKQRASAAANTKTGTPAVAAPATASNPPATIPGSTVPAPSADAFDAGEFDALPLPDKLDKAAHASLNFKMALIASTDVATASDARIRAALNAAQSIVLIKARIDEVKFHAAPPDNSAEHRVRWERLKRERAARASQGAVIDVDGIVQAKR